MKNIENAAEVLNLLILLENLIVLKGRLSGSVIMDKAGLSPASFHTSMLMLQDQNLIERRNGKYLITFLGRAVSNVRTLLEKAVNHYYQLKVIDSIREKQELSMSELQKIIDIMIEDYQLKDILNGSDRNSKLSLSH